LFLNFHYSLKPWFKVYNIFIKNKTIKNNRFYSHSSKFDASSGLINLTKPILNPIFLIKNKLACPIFLTDHIDKAIKLSESIYSSIPDKNLVKFFVRSKLFAA
jgi:hypothetical protein